MTSSPAARRLLRRHFLRRFLDNDLISPNADRHEVLVLLAAALAVPGLVITVVLLGQKYVIGIPTPALTSVAALDDKFLYISASMLIMALMAAVQWDALSLDERDTAILGPLPMAPREIGRAKLQALVTFVAAFALMLNGIPSVIFPLLTVSHFHVNIIAVVRMITVHAVVTMAAGAYAFLTILLLRELLRVVFSPRWFRRVSALVQTVLVITLGTTLLLLPAIASSVPAKWLNSSEALRTVPPAWFLGLYEAGTGRVALAIRGLGLRIPARLGPAERDAGRLYDALLPRFGELAHVAIMVLGGTAALALGLYLWNNRTLPLPQASLERSQCASRHVLSKLCARLLVPSPIPRAGFFFTVQTLARCVQHRITLAGACAISIAAGILLMNGIRAVSGASAAPTRLLALQTIVLAIILAGVRQALAIPADLRANWLFSMAWNEQLAPFVTGVKTAVLGAVVIPLLTLMCVLNGYLMGVLPALQHGVVGFMLSLITIEIALRPSKLPLTCSTRPPGNLKALAPIYMMVLFVLAYNLALIERRALMDVRWFTVVMGVLVVIYAGARLTPWRRPPLLSRIEFDDASDSPTQRLGLSEPV